MGSYLSAFVSRLTLGSIRHGSLQTHDELKASIIMPRSLSKQQQFNEKMLPDLAASTTLRPLEEPPVTTTASPAHTSLPPRPAISPLPDSEETFDDTQTASEFIELLRSAPTLGAFRDSLSEGFHATSWTSSLALAILHAIEGAINANIPLGPIQEAVERARKDVDSWVAEHPVMAKVIVTIVALGVLAYITPWVLEALGFASLGPRLGEFIPSFDDWVLFLGVIV